MKNTKCKAQILEQVKLRADDEQVSKAESDACALDVCVLFLFLFKHAQTI